MPETEPKRQHHGVTVPVIARPDQTVTIRWKREKKADMKVTLWLGHDDTVAMAIDKPEDHSE